MQSFLNSINYIVGQASDLMLTDDDAAPMDAVAFNNTLRPLLLQGGLQLNDQFQQLEDLMIQNMTATNSTELDDTSANEISMIWFLRLLMSTTVYTYNVGRFTSLQVNPLLILLSLFRTLWAMRATLFRGTFNKSSRITILIIHIHTRYRDSVPQPNDTH